MCIRTLRIVPRCVENYASFAWKKIVAPASPEKKKERKNERKTKQKQMKEQKPNGEKNRKHERRKSRGKKKNWSRNNGRKTRYALPVLPLFDVLLSQMFPCNWMLVRVKTLLVHARILLRFVSSPLARVPAPFRFRVVPWKEAWTDTARQDERHSLSLCSLLFVLFLLLLSLSLLIMGSSLQRTFSFFFFFFLQFFFHRIVLTRNSDQFSPCT